MTRTHRITGMGCLSAAGLGRAETVRTFFDGANSCSILNTAVSEFLQLQVRDEWIARFDFPQSGLRPTLYALVAIDEALADAGMTFQDLRNQRVGLCLGSTVGGTNYQPAFNEAYFRGEKPDPAPMFEYFRNNSAQWISRRYGWSGPSLLINNACTSGADAVGVARGWLDAGLCDIAICGGTEAILPKIYYGFRSLQLCSPSMCAPFDRDRQGITLGDGAGILILEKSNSPRPAKAHLLGYATANDALHPTSPHPEARGLDLAARAAMRDSGLDLGAIDFVNVHGTATPSNDRAEGRWIARSMPQARVVATKGYTGHTLGAAGALEAVFTAMSLQEGRLPASRGFLLPDPEIGVSPTTAQESGEFELALSFSLGFGGINSVLALGRAP